MSGELERRGTDPIRLDDAERELALVQTPAEAKALYDKLEALKQYAKRYGLDHRRQNKIAAVKLRTARKGGDLLAETVSHGGERWLDVASRDNKLPEGMSRSQSSRWQTINSVPEDRFEGKIAEVEPSDDELTLATMLRLAKELEREAKRDENEQLVQEAPRLADVGERFSAIVLDPPWDWGDEGDVDQFGRATPTYATMPLDELADQPIGDLVQADAHLYLWITNRSLPKGFGLLDGWGFRYVTTLTWVKSSFGMGNYFRGSTEHVLFGVRGSLALLRDDVGTHFEAPRTRGEHSRKPEGFYELVESCSPGPWFEWPARRKRNGWVVSGAEVA